MNDMTWLVPSSILLGFLMAGWLYWRWSQRNLQQLRDSEEKGSLTENSPASLNRPSWIPFICGIATATVAALLISSTSPSAVTAPLPDLPAPSSPSPPIPAHQAAPEVVGEEAIRLTQLEAHLRDRPDDLSARKELAVLLLNHHQPVRAFEVADELLQRDPNDPDGLYVQGSVRLLMGQAQRSIELLDRVLGTHPDHLMANLARSRALERLRGKQEAPTLGPPWTEAAQPEELQSLFEAVRERSPANGDSVRLRVELASGARAFPQATLFVSIRDTEGGPPAAVKKIEAPSFPVELTLGLEDSMMGLPLPEAGILTVRLDGDGNASTTEPSDLSASGNAHGDGTTVLLLQG
ncbi:MAG: hypothetical protein K0U98_18300 [Deltaproteobacteria bacterium]|nr:hypothetical protein [Deltaproteobacteria bacterium]